MKKIFLAAVLAAVCGTSSFAGGAFPASLAGSPVFSDPVFQDYMETAGGYLDPAGRIKPARLFRDAPASPSVRGVRIFVTVTPATGDLRGLLRELSAAGFELSGERTSYGKRGKRTRLLGWLSPASLDAVRALPGVARVRVAAKKPGPRA